MLRAISPTTPRFGKIEYRQPPKLQGLDVTQLCALSSDPLGQSVEGPRGNETAVFLVTGTDDLQRYQTLIDRTIEQNGEPTGRIIVTNDNDQLSPDDRFKIGAESERPSVSSCCSWLISARLRSVFLSFQVFLTK